MKLLGKGCIVVDIGAEPSWKIIGDLLQQRNELLDALKAITTEYDKTCDTGEMPHWPFEDAKSVITKTEAEE